MTTARLRLPSNEFGTRRPGLEARHSRPRWAGGMCGGEALEFLSVGHWPLPWRGKCPHEMGHLAIVGVKVDKRALKLLAKERHTERLWDLQERLMVSVRPTKFRFTLWTAAVLIISRVRGAKERYECNQEGSLTRVSMPA